MAQFDFCLPRMGESIQSATILKWLVEPGQVVSEGDVLLEVGTDKVDSDVVAPVSGTLTAILQPAGQLVEVGQILATIALGEGSIKPQDEKPRPTESPVQYASESPKPISVPAVSGALGFLSPLLRSIVLKENISLEELATIPASGAAGRLQKSDVFQYLRNRKHLPGAARTTTGFTKPLVSYIEGHDTLVEMDRMQRMIAGHMVYSKQTSPHVTAYIEIDVTSLSEWRNRMKGPFEAAFGQKLTFTPLFVEAVCRALADFPQMNASFDNDRIVLHKDVHIGMATALPNGNLIVPVLRNAGAMALSDLASGVNALSAAARNATLKPDEVQGSTFTISNVGTFGSLMGTPIINQPEAGILAFGTIQRKPAVIQTPEGEQLAIRSMMFLSLSFDHRIVNGHLGGSFLRRVGDYLEQFDPNRTLGPSN